jgi:hypothetical protein
VKPSFLVCGEGLGRRGRSLLAAATVLACLCSAAAQDRHIRLRNETIRTQPRAGVAAMAAGLKAQTPAAGLFLVQFEGPVDPGRKAQLRGLGIELLKYVPDDAFIARFKDVRPDTVAALSYTRWLGPYRPDYKIHPRLAAAAQVIPQTNQVLSVTVLASAQATADELAQVRSLFSTIAHESRLRQGTFVRGQLPPASLDALAASSAVLWIERTPRRRLVDEPASKLVGGDDGLTATPTLTQQLGFGGAGVTVCVADTGLDTGDTNTMHPDLRGRVTGFKYYGDNISDGSDGYGHGTHVAGIVAGNAATGETDPDFGTLYGLGVASEASLFIERIFDESAGEAQPFPSDETLAQDAVNNGADIGCNSWGNDVQGEYDNDAAQFDELVRDVDRSIPTDQPYILEFSSGNAGPDSQTVGSPATGKNVIATGACENTPGMLALTYGLYADGSDTMADFSSRGPCEDGRIKPDIVAAGTWIASAASSAAWDLASISWTAIDDYYVYMGGTSMSGPYAAGAAAVFVQYYKTFHAGAKPSPALVKAALINSANELDQFNGGPGPIPNNEEGWGRIALTNIIVTNFSTAPRYYEYVDQTSLLTDGEVYIHHSLVRAAGQPLKVTLAYTDVPGFPGAIPALVNDLDLEVVAPDGTIYRGNQFAGSESVPNAPSPDTINNVEAVHLANPAPGDYLVRVRARHIVQDAFLDTSVVDQDFALVVSGDLARPGTGSILLDRAAYTAPGVVQITAFDPARAGTGSVSVVLKSTSEPAGESYPLNAAGTYGAFTGAVATVLGPAASDRKLDIHDGDAIQAWYVDSTGSNRVATAVADLVAPGLSGVSTGLDLGVIGIAWQTTEPASSIVRYSTNLSFSLAVTNAALTTSHQIRLSNLVPGSTYHFYVVSADLAGNTTTNNNYGTNFTFTGVATPNVLMVDAWDIVTEDEDGFTATDIPDSVYTNALAASGFTYAFWKVTQRGSPQLGDLQPFAAVIWRTTDDLIYYVGTNNTLSAQQQFMIQNYLNGGGSFFTASMSLASMLGNVPFRKNVLQMAGFKQNPDPPSPCTDCDEYFGVPAVLGGSARDPITAGMYVTLDYSLYPGFDLFDIIYGPDFSCTFTPATNATPIFFESVSGKACGMSYPRVGVDSPGRVVFLSFPLDAVPATGISPNNEVTLLRNALKFLTPGANGTGSMDLNSSLYSIPDQITVEVGDSDLAGAGPAQVSFATSSSTNRVTAVLSETTHRGLFRGFLTLVATNAAANQLAVRSGDIVTATYFDASNGSNVIATATVDVVPPAITNVSAVTGYGDATVSWLTSKAADSLVQYGESTLLGRTAYSGRMVTNHAVTLGGLLASRNYYYQVVSRDEAGNTAVDDRQGNLYTFSTRQAPRPPWSDDLESGAPGWSVVEDPSGTAFNWSLGTPHNGLQTSAHSGVNAWGSNLDGQNLGLFDMASTFLFSPMIDLSGLTSATLTFSNCYDFSSMFVIAQLGISTDTSTPLADIPTVVDFGGQTAWDWERETVDLTPYVGQTIQVVWYYGAIGDGSGPPDGWLLDDISITGVSGGGTIVVMKNLGQGRFSVTGPIRKSGTAALTSITNAPLGPYKVHFSDVTFYQTPPDQSATLSNAATLTFTGTYDFLDANTNGISDSWERYFFGSANANRTRFSDTDGDGMSDYAEFIAGTNPTNAASKLVFLAETGISNKFIQLAWAAIPGRLYQVQTSGLEIRPLPRLSGAMDRIHGYFNLHVEAPTNMPYVIQVSTNLALWGSVYTNPVGGRMDWSDAAAPGSARRFYRTQVLPAAATNLAGWTPVSGWLQASGSPMYYTTTNAGQGAHFYRVQVRP